ncbi:MAG: 2-hydroxyacid dehydrogenase [Sulfolobales archaeon]
MKALVYWPLAKKETRRIIEKGLSEDLDLIWASSLEDAMKAVAEVEIYIGSAQNWVLEKGEKLLFLQATHAGVDNLDLELAKRKGVTVASAKGVNSFYVAEMALALMLSLVKRIPEFDRMAKRDIFPPYSWEYSTRTLKGRTIVILGYGGIGRELARLLKPFGARVIGVRREGGASDDYADLIISVKDLEKYIGEADFLVITAPLTRETRGLVNKDLLSRMKKEAYIVNVGRGAIIDEDSLYEALSSRSIAGAALDVWWLYPGRGQGRAYSSRGVHKMDMVITTPHRAGFVEEAERDIAIFVVENVKRFIRGEEPYGLVDLDKGY